MIVTDSCRFYYQILLISEINNKKPENKFADSMRSMTDSLSSIADNLSEINKKEHTKFIDNMRSMMTSLSQSISKISEIDRKISQIDKNETDNMRSMVSSLSKSIDKVSEIDKKISYASLIEKFHNTYQLCNNDLDKFDLLLKKGVFPYEYMDNWNRFKEDKLPDKESFYSKLNNEHITDDDYAHSQKSIYNIKVFNIKNLGEYHDLYVQTNTAQLADVFENFRNTCLEIYELDPAHFLSAPGQAWQACLKKTSRIRIVD